MMVLTMLIDMMDRMMLLMMIMVVVMMIRVRDALHHFLNYQFQAVATEQAEFAARYKQIFLASKK